MDRNTFVTALSLSAVACLALGSAACVIDTNDDRNAYGYVVDPSPAPGGGNGGKTTPILAEVDTDQTLNANPGEGVGIYAEYATGGHWYIWWTCDTNQDATHRPCNMGIG